MRVIDVNIFFSSKVTFKIQAKLIKLIFARKRVTSIDIHIVESILTLLSYLSNSFFLGLLNLN